MMKQNRRCAAIAAAAMSFSDQRNSQTGAALVKSIKHRVARVDVFAKTLPWHQDLGSDSASPSRFDLSSLVAAMHPTLLLLSTDFTTRPMKLFYVTSAPGLASHKQRTCLGDFSILISPATRT
jgi:hypothetical protein